jgi:quercetin dioxygenase-like cupin family protein
MSRAIDTPARSTGGLRGSATRSARKLAGRCLTFDLAAEGEELQKEKPWGERGHNGRTLLKQPDLRIVLIAIKAGERIPKHRAAETFAVQTLTGRVRVRLPTETVDLPGGHLLALERALPHDVEALEQSTILVWLSWPPPPR